MSKNNSVCYISDYKESRESIAIKKYQRKEFGDPIFQLFVYDQIIDHLDLWHHLEGKILMYICRRTISSGHETFNIGAGDIGYAIGCDKRSVKRSRDRLEAQGWITVKETCCRNNIGINVKRIMALGKKFIESRPSRGLASPPVTSCHPLDKKSLISINTNNPTVEPKGSTEIREESLERAGAKKRLKPPKNTIGSISETWRTAWNASPFAENIRASRISPKESVKFSALVGNSRVKGKWVGSTEDLHDLVRWTVGHWEYLIYRQQWAKSMPHKPHIGWFVSQIMEICTIWEEETRNITAPFNDDIKSYRRKVESTNGWRKRGKRNDDFG